MTDWTKPLPATQLDLAFPANVIGTFLPTMQEIPKEFVENWSTGRWSDLASRLFDVQAFGQRSRIEGIVIDLKDGIEISVAMRHLQVALGSYEPKHEHKIAGVAFLLSLWLKDFEIT